MKNRIYKFMTAGYGPACPWVANRRLIQWEAYLCKSPAVAPSLSPAVHPTEHKVDEFVLKKTEMLIIELLSYSHSDLVNLRKEVRDAFHVHMTTPRIVTLIYRAMKEAGEADGVVSSRHREMIKSGQFSSNAVARCYSVAQAALQQGAKHSILSTFAQAAKMCGASIAPKDSGPSPKPAEKPAPKDHKKSPPKKGEDWSFYDR